MGQIDLLINRFSSLFLSVIIWVLHLAGIRFLTVHMISVGLAIFRRSLAGLFAALSWYFLFNRIIIKSDIDSFLTNAFVSALVVSAIFLVKAMVQLVMSVFFYGNIFRKIFKSARIEDAVMKIARMTGRE